MSALLDFFKRGEVPRDVRMLAARGAIAPRALEQLGILALLTTDDDAEIRAVAEETLLRIPVPLIAAFIARSDTPAAVRGFFEARGVVPAPAARPEPTMAAGSAAGAAPDADAALLEDGEAAGEPPQDDGENGKTIAQRVAAMTVPEKLKAAMKGSREIRAILVRDPNKLVALSVLSSPKLSETEVESIARMGSVGEDVLRTIAHTRAWVKHYGVVQALVRNAKTPVAVSMRLMQRLNDGDMKRLSTDRNVPDPLRIAARKKVVLGEGRS